MAERILTTIEAWDDFEANVLPGISEHWKIMNTLNQARRDRARGLLGQKRIKNLLEKHAPDRYRFEQRVILIEP